jgi:hypothetical protein
MITFFNGTKVRELFVRALYEALGWDGAEHPAGRIVIRRFSRAAGRG